MAMAGVTVAPEGQTQEVPAQQNPTRAGVRVDYGRSARRPLVDSRGTPGRM